MVTAKPHRTFAMDRSGPRGRAIRGPVAAAVVLAACLAWAAAPAIAGPASTSRPTSGPSEVTAYLPADEPVGIKTAAQMLTLRPDEKTVLDAVVEGRNPIQETGGYVMFDLAARMPKLDALQWDELDRPAYVNLLRDPARYRATPLRARLHVYRVWKLLPGAGLIFHKKYWPGQRPVWQMDCIWADEAFQKDKPVRVYSIVDPTPCIGQPQKVDSTGRRTYERGPEIRVAALFYKIYATREEASGARRDYPVLMIWQITPTVGGWGAGGGWEGLKLGQLAPLVILVAVLAVGFFFTRRRLAKLRESDRSRPKYRPLREGAGQEETPGPSKPRPNAETDKAGVDPDLAAAVEEFLHERHEKDGTDDRR